MTSKKFIPCMYVTSYFAMVNFSFTHEIKIAKVTVWYYMKYTYLCIQFTGLQSCFHYLMLTLQISPCLLFTYLMRPPSQGIKPYQVHYISVCCVLHAHVQFCRFAKADTTAGVHDTAITDRHSDTFFYR